MERRQQGRNGELARRVRRAWEETRRTRGAEMVEIRHLHPRKWNRHVIMGWRYDASELRADGELVPLGEAADEPPAPCVDECDTEEEYLTSDERDE